MKRPSADDTPTTAKPNHDYFREYQMAAEAAIGTAVVIALAILLVLIWNSLKRRNANGGDRTSGRPSVDSIDRMIEDRLRNRPPPYSTDADKPPTYDDLLHELEQRRRPSSSSSSAQSSRPETPQPPSQPVTSRTNRWWFNRYTTTTTTTTNHVSGRDVRAVASDVTLEMQSSDTSWSASL